MKNTKKYFFQSVEEARPVRASDVGEKMGTEEVECNVSIVQMWINNTIIHNLIEYRKMMTFMARIGLQRTMKAQLELELFAIFLFFVSLPSSSLMEDFRKCQAISVSHISTFKTKMLIRKGANRKCWWWKIKKKMVKVFKSYVFFSKNYWPSKYLTRTVGQ